MPSRLVPRMFSRRAIRLLAIFRSSSEKYFSTIPGSSGSISCSSSVVSTPFEYIESSAPSNQGEPCENRSSFASSTSFVKSSVAYTTIVHGIIRVKQSKKRQTFPKTLHFLIGGPLMRTSLGSRGDPFLQIPLQLS